MRIKSRDALISVRCGAATVIEDSLSIAFLSIFGNAPQKFSFIEQ
jgi:hypothetical protein